MTLPVSFIETQFPVSKLSKESYKERKANHGQTLTGLGKWWGRKPLVLVRAALVGLLMPATEDSARDREVFLRLLTMDDEGMLRRRNKSFTLSELFDLLTPAERRDAFNPDAKSIAFRRELSAEERKGWHDRAFLRLGYDRRLEMCARPEEIAGPSEVSWEIINAHCGTAANSLSEWVRQMGEKRFGHTPRVGDAFCGGGSVPFEAARIGSDLSPVAALLTWAALNIVGGGEEVAREVRHALQAVYDEAKREIEGWGIERNAKGWTADAYLYCHEVRDKGWLVPLAPSWIIGERTRTIAVLIPDPDTHTIRIEIRQGVPDDEIAQARLEGTWENGIKCPVDADGQMLPPTSRPITKVESVRGREGLRRWENDDLIPRPDDVFQERLYCIRWRLPVLKDLLWAEQMVHRTLDCSSAEREAIDVRAPDLAALGTQIEALFPFLTAEQQTELADLRARNWHSENTNAETLKQAYESLRGQKGGGQERLARAREAWQEAQQSVRERDLRIAALSAAVPETWYAAPDTDDLHREEEVLKILRDRFADWQAKGYLPSASIEGGYNQDQPMRERGYTHWHHLFNPRQLLTLGLFAYLSDAMQFKGAVAVGCLIGLSRMANWNARLSSWMSGAINEGGSQVFYNQSLNTLEPFSKVVEQ